MLELGARPELRSRAECPVNPLADAGDRRSARGSSSPLVLRVDVPVVVVETQVGDRGDRDWGEGEAGGAGIDTGLQGPGHLQAAEGEQVPEQVGDLASEGVGPGVLEVEPAPWPGDVGFSGVTLGDGGEPLAAR